MAIKFKFRFTKISFYLFNPRITVYWSFGGVDCEGITQIVDIILGTTLFYYCARMFRSILFIQRILSYRPRLGDTYTGDTGIRIRNTSMAWNKQWTSKDVRCQMLSIIILCMNTQYLVY